LKFSFGRNFILFTLLALSCSYLILAEEQANDQSIESNDWQDKTVSGAKKVGEVVVEGAATGYNVAKETLNDTLNYFKNSTVEDVGHDFAEGAKKVGEAVAEGTATGLKAVAQSINDSVKYFKNSTVEDVGQDIKEGAKKVGGAIAEGAESAWNKLTGFFS
jgi:hypothetical protein